MEGGGGGEGVTAILNTVKHGDTSSILNVVTLPLIISLCNEYLLFINRMQGPYSEILSPRFSSTGRACEVRA